MDQYLRDHSLIGRNRCVTGFSNVRLSQDSRQMLFQISLWQASERELQLGFCANIS
jgi:hypothetical protein